MGQVEQTGAFGQGGEPWSTQQKKRMGMGIERWLNGSLRRWLISPVMATTVLISLMLGITGAQLIDAVFMHWQTQVLLVSSRGAANTWSVAINGVAETGARMAQQTQLIDALRSDNRDAIPALVAMPDPTIASILVVDATNSSVDHLVPSADVPEARGWSQQTFRDASIESSIQHALNDPPGARSQVNISNKQEEPILYTLSSVGSTQQEGLLVLGVLLQDLADKLGSTDNGNLVFYDLVGRPLLTVSNISNLALADVPHLDNAALTSGSDNEEGFNAIKRVELPNGAWAYSVVPVDAAMQPIGYVGVWQPMAEVVASVRRLQATLLGIIAAIMLTLMYLSLRLTDQVVRPVQSLVNAAQAVADGSAGAYVPERPVGELVVLADAFNQISAQVRHQTDVLLEQARQSTYLFEASAELGRTLHLDESLQAAAEAIYGLGGMSYVVILAGRGELGPYYCRAARGFSSAIINQMIGREYSVPLWGVMARALVGGQPLVIDDIIAQNRPRAGEFDFDIGRGSMLLFPVTGASGPSGLIIAGSDRPKAFSTGSLGDLVFALARIAAQSIQNAQLYEEAARSQEQLVTLQVISKLVASASEIDSVLELVVRETGEVMGDSIAWLFLKDVTGGHSRFYGQPGHSGSELWTGVHQDAVSWVIQGGQPIFYDPQQALSSTPILVHSGPAMCVPLEVNEETIGALIVVSRNPRRAFAEDDMIVLRTVTNAAAVGLRTAQLSEHCQSDYLNLAAAWAGSADHRIWGAAGHSARVAANALSLARAVSLPHVLYTPLKIAGYLHDIGASNLAEEYQLNSRGLEVSHAAVAASWLFAAGMDERVVTLVRYHHDTRPDLAISDPDLGRATAVLALVNIVDCWLARIVDEKTVSPTEVRERLKAEAGRSFPSPLVTELLNLWTAERLVVPHA